jgi:hypothetical protein
MLGTFDNFPDSLHYAETFKSDLTKKNLQRLIIQAFQGINEAEFNFEEVSNPTLPSCRLIFEFGIADKLSFCYLDEETSVKLQEALVSTAFPVMDWFCSIRYYKILKKKKSPLKFDYYLLRIGFGEKGTVGISVFHDHGLRYVSPEDLVSFIVRRINHNSARKILKPVEPN